MSRYMFTDFVGISDGLGIYPTISMYCIQYNIIGIKLVNMFFPRLDKIILKVVQLLPITL